MLTIYCKGIEPFGMEAYTLDNQNYKMVKGQCNDFLNFVEFKNARLQIHYNYYLS